MTVVLLMMTAPACLSQVNQEAIDAVAAGTLTEARASWWGFDPEDSTEALQAAIDSGVPRLVVDRMAGPWIVRPMQLVSDQEIFFEPGVDVVARRGEFKGTGDSLFTASNKENIRLIGYGATLRMHRSDYDTPELYQRGEWRMVLKIMSCSNVDIHGLTLAESGGDGIYLGTGARWVTNRNIHVKDVICESNYRQGISVITAQNLLIEDTILRNTGGTPPAAGIDFEPNFPEERLSNIVMRNVLTENNAGAGYLLYSGRRVWQTSIRFENCRSVNDSSGVILYTPNEPVDFRGTIRFSNCTIEGSRGPGVSIVGKPAAGYRLRFVRSSVLDTASTMPASAQIMFTNGPNDTHPTGGVRFTDLHVRDRLRRPAMGYADNAGLPIVDITGNLRLEHRGRVQALDLTDELMARWMPRSDLKHIPRMTLEGLEMAPVAEGLPAEPFAFGSARMRGQGRFVVWAREGEQVTLRLYHGQVATYAGSSIPVHVLGPSGSEAHRATTPFKEEADITFTAPETGLYRVTANAGSNWLSIVSSTHPVSIIGEHDAMRLIYTTGDFYFWVPAGTEEFGVRVAGDGTAELVRAALYDPAGNLVEDVDNIAAVHQFEVRQSATTEGAAWMLRLSTPSSGVLEDKKVDLRGIPPLLGPAPEALLRPR